MRLALGTLFLWLAAACFYLASRGLQATSPFGAYQTIIAKIREGGEDGQAAASGE